jgi:hypothetical protein
MSAGKHIKLAVIGLVGICALSCSREVDPKSMNVYRQLDNFAVLMTAAESRVDTFPSTLPSAVDLIEKDSELMKIAADLRLDWGLFKGGQDPWGSQLKYEWSSSSRQLLIRSFGPNHKDDGGKLDDLEQIVTFAEPQHDPKE